MIRWTAALVIVLCTNVTAADDKTLRIGLFYGNPNPFRAITYSPYAVHPLQFDALVDLDSKGQVIPALATSWRAENETAWVFELRAGVAFSNGEPCDAAAVVATLDFLRSNDGRIAAAQRETRSIVSARARGPLTVEIKTLQPDAMLPGKLFSAKIMPPRYLADVGIGGIERKPIGTGPFIELERADARVKFKAYRESWRAPKIDGVDLIMTQNPTVRIQALRARQIDLAFDIKPEDAELLQGEGMTIVSHPIAAVSVVQFITNKNTPLSDSRVRRALNYAIDKDAIVRQLLRGQAVVARQFTPSYAFGAIPNPPEPFPYDPARARALLTEAGYPDGFSMTVELVGSFDNVVHEQIAAELRKIGVDVILRPQATPEFTSRLFNNQWEGDAFDYGYIVFPSLDSLAPLRLHSCLNPKPWHCDRQVADLMVAADAEFDLGRRRALTEQVMRLMIDDPPGILLTEGYRSYAALPHVVGLEAPMGLIRYEKIDFGAVR